MYKPLSAIIIIVFTACNQSQPQGATKTMDFGRFTIETPHFWRQIKVKGIDSYVGKIAIGDSDVLHFDLGWYSNDLSEYQEVKMEDNKTYYIHSTDTANSPTLLHSAHKDSAVKTSITWGTIDGRRAKLLSPIKSGIGTTGIYIDSLWKDGSDIEKFNLYGINLSPRNEKTVLTAIRTLKFQKSE